MHLYAQLVDDMGGKTLLAVSTLQKRLREQIQKGGNVEAAKRMGQILAQAAKAAGIQKVVFDRGGYRYFGRVKAVAETAREGGLEL
jgi:large subunit ribosomal protein L18